MGWEQMITSGAGLIKALADLLSVAEDPSVLVSAGLVAAGVGAGLHLYRSWKDQKEWGEFCHFLYQNDFYILPQICLALEQGRKVNALHVREMKVTYTYDLSAYDGQQLSPEQRVEYPCTIDYELKTENKKLPAQFFHLRGNMNAVGETVLEQKHGNQSGYVKVNPRVKSVEKCQKSAEVKEFSWLLDKQHSSPESLYKIFIRCHYREESPADFVDSIIFYPWQFANKVDRVEYEFRFIGGRHMLKHVELDKYFIDGKKPARAPKTQADPEGNCYTYDFIPDSVKCEAYRFKLRYELSTEQK